jgi:hypothetical protein
VVVAISQTESFAEEVDSGQTTKIAMWDHDSRRSYASCYQTPCWVAFHSDEVSCSSIDKS